MGLIRIPCVDIEISADQQSVVLEQQVDLEQADRIDLHRTQVAFIAAAMGLLNQDAGDEALRREVLGLRRRLRVAADRAHCLDRLLQLSGHHEDLSDEQARASALSDMLGTWVADLDEAATPWGAHRPPTPAESPRDPSRPAMKVITNPAQLDLEDSPC